MVYRGVGGGYRWCIGVWEGGIGDDLCLTSSQDETTMAGGGGKKKQNKTQQQYSQQEGDEEEQTNAIGITSKGIED